MTTFKNEPTTRPSTAHNPMSNPSMPRRPRSPADTSLRSRYWPLHSPGWISRRILTSSDITRSHSVTSSDLTSATHSRGPGDPVTTAATRNESGELTPAFSGRKQRQGRRGSRVPSQGGGPLTRWFGATDLRTLVAIPGGPPSGLRSRGSARFGHLARPLCLQRARGENRALHVAGPLQQLRHNRRTIPRTEWILGFALLNNLSIT
jgi:hypothetical protein